MAKHSEQGLWTLLTRPFPSVEGKIRRYDAQLLSQLLLLLFPLGLLLFLLPGFIRPDQVLIQDQDVFIFFGALLSWLVAMILARTNYYKLSATITTFVSSGILLWYTIVDQSLMIAFYVSIPIIISGILLSLRWTTALAVISTVFLYSAPLLNPQISLIDLILSPISFLSIASTLIIIFIRYRDQVRHDREEEIIRLYEKAQEEIRDRERAEQKLLHNAFHDNLTGLPNRSLFHDRLEQSLLRSKRYGEALVGVLFLDLDRFKDVNDSLGHSAGDELLVKISSRLQTAVREVDTVARFGGDEFVILLENVADTEDVIRITERIQGSLEAPFLIEDRTIYTSASIGIVLCGRQYSRFEEILRDADIAMYQAKEKGGGKYEIYAREMRERRLSRIKLENDLRWAIHHGELQLFYQPIVSLQTGFLSGFEALIRWNHPELGLIFPAEFITVAEETDLIISMGRWALQEACLQIAEWRRVQARDRDLYMNINSSAKELLQSGYVEQVLAILEETKAESSSLNLEITESILIDRMDVVRDTLEGLSQHGIGIQLDDFGTGYSSLSHIGRLPIDSIKIDRSFVSDMDIDQGKVEITRSVIDMAKAMDLQVYAEGIESAWQLSMLRQLGADFGQGYYICRPNDKTAISDFINGASVRPQLAPSPKPPSMG